MKHHTTLICLDCDSDQITNDGRIIHRPHLLGISRHQIVTKETYSVIQQIRERSKEIIDNDKADR